MKRHVVDKRHDWEKLVVSQGLLYHTSGGVPYWDEGACYSFTTKQVDHLERVTGELWDMCLKATAHVIEHGRYEELGVPSTLVPLIEHTWEAEPPALYSRFDLSWNGLDEPKLLEFNADTPTSLLESAAIQWLWKEDVFPGFDQFNSLEPKLVAKWRELLGGYLFPGAIHFASDGAVEDRMTVGYLMKTAIDAMGGGRMSKHGGGLVSTFRQVMGYGDTVRPCVEMRMDQIGWDRRRKLFVDLADTTIRNVFKLYPWETMITQSFGEHLTLETLGQMHWIEPAWKVLMTNKGLLAILWELFPGHPNLLPAYLNGPSRMESYARKPFYSREGQNVRLVKGGCVLESTAGAGRDAGHVFQGLALLPDYDGNHPVVGSWLVDGEAAGVGIRESEGFITGNTSRFVPHYIDE